MVSGERPTVLPISQETLRWVMQAKTLSRGDARTRWLYRWQAFWFERNLALQSRLPAAPAPHDPLFVLGVWRSGTTFAHTLLRTLPGFCAPETWQCMNPSTFVASGSPRARGLDRPMDSDRIETFSAQEDEFALLALGVESVYRGFFDPGRLGELEALLDPDHWEGRDDWAERLQSFIGPVCRLAGKERIVLKSPNHSYRVKSIARAFPQATFVWIVRDPAALLHSNRKMWGAMQERYALNDADAATLDRFLLRALDEAGRCLDWLCQRVGPERLAVVDFSTLTAAPAATVTGIAERLGLTVDPAAVQAALEASPQVREGRGPDRYEGKTLPGGSAPVFARLAAAHCRALESHGLTTGTDRSAGP